MTVSLEFRSRSAPAPACVSARTSDSPAQAMRLRHAGAQPAANPMTLAGAGGAAADRGGAVRAVDRHARPAGAGPRQRAAAAAAPRTGSAPTNIGRDMFSRLVYGSRITLYIVALVTVIVGPIGLAVGTAVGLLRRLGRHGADAHHRHLHLVPQPGAGAGLRRRAGPGPGACGDRHRADRLAADRAAGAGRNAVAAQGRFRRRRCSCRARRRCGSWCATSCRCACPSVLVRLTMNMAGIILTAAGLGFLGLGAQPPLPEWGAMISSGPALHAGVLVAGGDAGRGDHAGQPGVQPDGRWPARRARSTQLKRSSTDD